MPSRSSAETVQGEVIRIAGKLAREIAENGAVNRGPSRVIRVERQERHHVVLAKARDADGAELRGPRGRR